MLYADCVEAADKFNGYADRHGWRMYEFHAQEVKPAYEMLEVVTPVRYPYRMYDIASVSAARMKEGL